MPTTPAAAYVRFADGVEGIQPDEQQQLTGETVESMARLNRFMFEKHRHAIRDAHAKSLASSPATSASSPTRACRKQKERHAEAQPKHLACNGNQVTLATSAREMLRYALHDVLLPTTSARKMSPAGRHDVLA